jgi:hypothetical protein
MYIPNLGPFSPSLTRRSEQTTNKADHHIVKGGEAGCDLGSKTATGAERLRRCKSIRRDITISIAHPLAFVVDDVLKMSFIKGNIPYKPPEPTRLGRIKEITMRSHRNRTARSTAAISTTYIVCVCRPVEIGRHAKRIGGASPRAADLNSRGFLWGAYCMCLAGRGSTVTSRLSFGI